MKRLISVLLCAIMLIALPVSLIGCGEPRDEVLKLYMPGEYIDESIFESFEKWYKEETGKKVKVKLETFEAVENIQTAVEGGKADYDLLCPSDYMVEYLIGKNLLQKIDTSIIDVKEEGLFKEEYLESAREYDPNLEYSVPYMYGTLGIVYDYSKTNRHIDSWEDYFGNAFSSNDAKLRSIKESMRDAYAAACIYGARAELVGLEGEAQKQAVQRVFEDTSPETIEKARQALTAIRPTSVWDVDNIKFEMAEGKSTVAIALMWSCDAGYVMNDYEDDNGDNHEGNRNLWYVVPKEGGNVYIDNFVISTYAKNVTAANYFLKYLCTTDIAVINSEYAGCISPITEAYDELKAYYEDDEDGMFEGVSEDWKAMFMETMFPSLETLNRCGVMKDLKGGLTAVNNMWSSIV